MVPAVPSEFPAGKITYRLQLPVLLAEAATLVSAMARSAEASVPAAVVAAAVPAVLGSMSSVVGSLVTMRSRPLVNEVTV